MSWKVSFFVSRTAPETSLQSSTDLQQTADYRDFCYNLPHVHTQTNRGPQYVPTTFPYGLPIKNTTNVPGLDAQNELYYPRLTKSYRTKRTG